MMQQLVHRISGQKWLLERPFICELPHPVLLPELPPEALFLALAQPLAQE
jgi:hypothetical protein